MSKFVYSGAPILPCMFAGLGGTPAPTVSSVSPDTGPDSGGTLVMITVDDTTGVTAAHVNGVAITGLEIYDATTIFGTTAAGMSGGLGDVTVTAGGTGTLAGAFTAMTTSFSADFAALPLGPVGSMPAGLSFARASTATVQLSLQMIATGFANDTPLVGANTDDGISRGLVFEHAATNQAYPSVMPATSAGVWAQCPGTSTLTAAATLAPDGAQTATQMSIPDRSSYTGFLLVSNPQTGATWSFWAQSAHGANTTLKPCVNSSSRYDIGTFDTRWRRNAKYLSASSYVTFDNRSTSEDNTDAPVVNAELWGFQCESGKIATELIPTTSGTVTRAGSRLFMSTGSAAFTAGRCNLNLELRPKGDVGDYAFPIRIFSDPNDATTYVEITSGLLLDVVVGGTHWTPTAILSWKKDTDVKFFISFGGGKSSAKYMADGQCVIDLGQSGANMGAIAPSGAVEFLCDGTTKQFTSRVQKLEGYTAGVPAWTLQAPRDGQLYRIVADGDSITVTGGAVNGGSQHLNSWPAQMGALLGAAYGDRPINAAISGEQLSTMITGAPLNVDPYYSAYQDNICFIFGGANDIDLVGASAASVWANLQAYSAARRAVGFKVIMVTPLPRVPLVAMQATYDATRASLLTLMRAGSADWDALCDVAADMTIGQDGDESNATYYFDNVHPTAAGCAIIAGYAATAAQSVV